DGRWDQRTCAHGNRDSAGPCAPLPPWLYSSTQPLQSETAVPTSDYVCQGCHEVRSAGELKGRKYECATHGELCSEHVKVTLTGADHCKLCESQGSPRVKVVTYAWNYSYQAWAKY